ncbi:MAG: dTMP kinase [Granulosicoccaceae bacterium]
MRGVFITLEGLEGTGKTTNLGFITERLQQAGIEPLVTREPGGTPLGEALRDIILNRHDVQIDAMAELLMIFAARAQHLEQVIKPALARGQWVLSDRFTEASYAYQGAGRELGVEAVAVLERLVQRELQPDLTLLLDIDPELGLRRASATGAPDRIEQAGLSFFQRVRAGYLARAEQHRSRFCVVDASQPLPQVQVELGRALAMLLQAKGALS